MNVFRITIYYVIITINENVSVPQIKIRSVHGKSWLHLQTLNERWCYPCSKCDVCDDCVGLMSITKFMKQVTQFIMSFHDINYFLCNTFNCGSGRSMRNWNCTKKSTLALTRTGSAAAAESRCLDCLRNAMRARLAFT